MDESCLFASSASSGGKDGALAAIVANRYLDRVGDSGPRVCINADLGIRPVHQDSAMTALGRMQPADAA